MSDALLDSIRASTAHLPPLTPTQALSPHLRIIKLDDDESITPESQPTTQSTTPRTKPKPSHNYTYSQAMNINTIIQGYMDKKSPKRVVGVSVWQRRFFQLQHYEFNAQYSKYTIFYYKTQKIHSEEPLGMIELSQVQTLQPLKDGKLELLLPFRTFTLQVKNKQEYQQWLPREPCVALAAQ